MYIYIYYILLHNVAILGRFFNVTQWIYFAKIQDHSPTPEILGNFGLVPFANDRINDSHNDLGTVFFEIAKEGVPGLVN